MTLAAPFPYFGGKRRAAPIVWRALGDPSGYVEPFAGSGATVEAALEEGMRVVAIEKDPSFVPLIASRIDRVAMRHADP